MKKHPHSLLMSLSKNITLSNLALNASIVIFYLLEPIINAVMLLEYRIQLSKVLALLNQIVQYICGNTG